VVRVLVNSLKLNRVGHAYLFSGPRGTGKTTLARLLAKSLNCRERKAGEVEPCNVCSSCREINLGTSMDIIEIDAASNRGIDEIRALRDKIGFAPSGKKYKVFIIDEVHMLTREAFNALLKTLEEPPAHAVFILATTELHKVPETIISRTLEFDFHLHNFPDIVKNLQKIVKAEKIKIDPVSVKLIAQAAKGGMRDAITLLDQVATSAGVVDENLTRSTLGLSSFETLAGFIKFLIEKNPQKLLGLIDRLYVDGVDFYQFIFEALEMLRKILLFKHGYEKALNDYTKEEKETIVKIACPSKLSETKRSGVQNVQTVEIVQMLERILIAYQETKNAEIVQLPLELAVLELTRTNADLMPRINADATRKDAGISQKSKDASLENRETKVEGHPVSLRKAARNEGSNRDSSHASSAGQNDEKIKSNINDKKPETRKLETSKKAIDIGKIKEGWKGFLEKMADDKTYRMLLENSAPLKWENEKLVVGVQFKFYKDKLDVKKNYERIGKLLESHYGQVIPVNFIVDEKLVKTITVGDGQTSINKGSGLAGEAEDIFA